MSNAGNTVWVHYVGTLDDGTQFDSSRDRGEPLKFVCMAHQMIPGFDKAVEDMEVGEVKTVKIPPEEAYGEWREDAVKRFPVRDIPNADQLPVGQTIAVPTGTGEYAPVKVVSIEDGIVTFDANHELAGKTLTFEIELISVKESKKKAASSGGCCC